MEAAELNQANRRGGTPLLIACQKGHIEVAKLLVGAGATLTRLTGIDGGEVLFDAAHSGQVEWVQLLLSAQARHLLPGRFLIGWT